MLEIKLCEPKRFFTKGPPSHLLCLLFKLRHQFYSRVFITIEFKHTLNLHGFIFCLYRTQTRCPLLRRVCLGGRLRGIYLSEVRFSSTFKSQNLAFPWKSFSEFMLHQGKQRMELVLFNCVRSSIFVVWQGFGWQRISHTRRFFFGHSITKTFFTCSSEDF